MWVNFIKKNKKKKTPDFCQRLCLDCIQNDDKNIDCVDHQYQFGQSYIYLFMGLSFSLVTLSSYDIYAVGYLINALATSIRSF